MRLESTIRDSWYAIKALLLLSRNNIKAEDNLAPDGEAGQALISNGPNAPPSWQSITAIASTAWSAITGKPTSLAGYGILDAYTKPQVDNIAATKANVAHTHDAADIISGTVATARLGSGAAGPTTFLRGDQTWGAPTAVVAISSATVAITDGDSARRVTITDAAVVPASKIILTVKRPDTTDATDPGIVYVPTVVRVGTGDFDVLLMALGLSGDDPTGIVPSETITLYYQVA